MEARTPSLNQQQPDPTSTQDSPGVSDGRQARRKRAGKAGTPDQRERQILEAAVDLFYERGFVGTSMAAIGRHLGVTGPAIYSHFKNKDDILATLVREGVDYLYTRIGTETDDPFKDSEHLIRTHTDVVLGNWKLATVYVRESRSLGVEHQTLLDHHLKEYSALWVRRLRRCYPDHPEALLTVTGSAAAGLANSVVLWRDRAVETPELRELLVSMCRAAVAALGDADPNAPQGPAR